MPPEGPELPTGGIPSPVPEPAASVRLARGAITFLDWLDSAGLTLGSCQQADLDLWLASGQAVYREEAGRLIRWAHTARLTSCYLPSAARWTGPAAVLGGEDRWEIARRLLHDDTLKSEDRLAGLLVLLYAQAVTAISRMTAGQVQSGDGIVRLHLGRVPLKLPEPVASIALAVAANRKGHATIGAAGPSPWLFPGASPDSRSAARGLPSGSTRSGPAPARPAARHCSSSPPRSPPPSSPALSTSAPMPPSPGSVCPQATGRPTLPRSAADPGTNPFHHVTKRQASHDRLCPLPCRRTRYSDSSNNQLCRYTSTRATWIAMRTASTALLRPQIRPESGQMTRTTTRMPGMRGDDLGKLRRARRDSNPQPSDP